MKNILLCWIGNTDIRTAEATDTEELGPIARALEDMSFDRVVLLGDGEPDRKRNFADWLRARTTVEVELRQVELSSPMAMREIYDVAHKAAGEVLAQEGGKSRLTFHISPGTSVMAAVWVLLSRIFNAEVIESSRDHGAKPLDVPFEIKADLIPDIVRHRDKHLERLIAGELPASFDRLVAHHNRTKQTLQKAALAASRTVPVLLVGDSGTGKTTLAGAMHKASPVAEGPFVPVNCGAIPKELVESEMFGHVKGSFSGAAKDHAGYFLQAHRGTLFLDEIGELTLDHQVKLLRALEENQVRRVGAERDEPARVRIIAATNRNLQKAVFEGAFREDLYYRLAVAVIQIPSLAERPSDIPLLVREILDEINEESEGEPGYQTKALADDAMPALQRHTWPGNVRELRNVLWQGSLWSTSSTITGQDIRDALNASVTRDSGLLEPLGDGFDINALTDRIQRHYLQLALAATGNNKSQAARVLGLNSHQALNKWIARLDLHVE